MSSRSCSAATIFHIFFCFRSKFSLTRFDAAPIMTLFPGKDWRRSVPKYPDHVLPWVCLSEVRKRRVRSYVQLVLAVRSHRSSCRGVTDGGICRDRLYCGARTRTVSRYSPEQLERGDVVTIGWTLRG